jgi:hypothetical protein
LSVMVQCNKRDASLLSSNGCISKTAHDNKFAKSVEAALYAYPLWKVSFEQCKYLYGSGVLEGRYMNEWSENIVDGIGVLRREYILRIKLIEETMTILSPIQREFIQQRYFGKMPFKIIAEAMAVAERHLYRIRQEVIQVFTMVFGWQEKSSFIYIDG